MTIKVTLILMMSQQGIKKKRKLNYKQFEIDNEINKELKLDEKTGRLMLPKWIKVSEKRFNEILNTVTKAKNNGLKVNVDGREISPKN